MREISTDRQDKVPEKTCTAESRKALRNERRRRTLNYNAFPPYIKKLISEKGLTQRMVFLKADVSEHYGYKLLACERRTQQRDVILRLCYAAELTLEETQEALTRIGMPNLDAENPRDALLMTVFKDRPGSIIDVNILMRQNHHRPLRTSGSQD